MTVHPLSYVEAVDLAVAQLCRAFGSDSSTVYRRHLELATGYLREAGEDIAADQAQKIAVAIPVCFEDIDALIKKLTKR